LDDRWIALLRVGRPLSERESSALLAELGVPVLSSAVVASEVDLVAALRALTFPVVLKTATAGISHKTDVAGVVACVSTVEDALAAYRDLASRLGPDVSIQRQVSLSSGTELFLGMVDDDQFGPIVTIGAGGVWVETLDDTVSLMPPISREAARKAIGRLRVAPLLSGARGRPRGAVAALVDVMVAFGDAAMRLADHVAEIDVNPLFVGPDEVVALDALVVPKGAHGTGS
jgi:succinyl-CoA synthetase beta subunit